jgi:hypothetical protein
MQVTKTQNLELEIDSTAIITSTHSPIYVVFVNPRGAFGGVAVCVGKHEARYFTNKRLFEACFKPTTCFVLGGKAAWYQSNAFPCTAFSILNYAPNGEHVFYDQLLKKDFASLTTYRQVFYASIAACRMLDFHFTS